MDLVLNKVIRPLSECFDVSNQDKAIHLVGMNFWKSQAFIYKIERWRWVMVRLLATGMMLGAHPAYEDNF
jgi:hypothetical protein